MRIDPTFTHQKCAYYIAEYYIGFRTVAPKQGDHYIGKKYAYNTLVFVLDGEIEFSYDQYTNRRFKKGDMLFIPQASSMYGEAITDANMLVHTYDLAAESFHSNCILSKAKFDVSGISAVNYDFRPLAMSPSIRQFSELMQCYIASDYRCALLHDLKQKELFIIMQYDYTHREMMELFYPIVGKDIPFRNKVLRVAHEQLTIKEFAMRFNMGERSFSRRFQEEFGETVHQWLLKRKIAQVWLRLSHPCMSVADIVREFKFADTHHFYRFCKEQFGLTLKELKAKLIDEESV